MAVTGFSQGCHSSTYRVFKSLGYPVSKPFCIRNSSVPTGVVIGGSRITSSEFSLANRDVWSGESTIIYDLLGQTSDQLSPSASLLLIKDAIE